MKTLNRITNPILVFLYCVSLSLLFFCQNNENTTQIIKETNNDYLQKLYIKAIDVQLFYSEKYIDAMKILDFDKMKKYNDSVQISFGKVLFIYNEMYPNNAR
jgi:hypothetical protein